MSSSANNGRNARLPALALVAAAMLAGCADPDFYLDRRETISLHAGDAVAANIVAQTVDPWPREAANRNIVSNGERMQAAGERYRTGKTTPLKGLSTSSVQFDTSPGGGGAAPTAAPATK
jgi:hypothetical protein